MKRNLIFAGGLALALFAAAPQAHAQREGLDLSPYAKAGQTVSPFFEGWYLNPDGTYTLSFGYFNRNTDQRVEIPRGRNNFVEPAEYDGMQPETFEAVNYYGYNGRRERGVFAVRVPADFGDKEVVWTLRMDDKILRVPARINSAAYELSRARMAMGSAPPVVWFGEGGEKGTGVEGVLADYELEAVAGEPLTVAVWANDERSDREESIDLQATWVKHQGPGAVTFRDDHQTISDHSSDPLVNEVIFSEPGDYMLRIRVDNHRAPDSAPGDQCCWTNGYVKVKVAD